MSTIKPTTTQTISMRQQVLDNAAQALGKETEGPSFSERMGGAVREVADAQNTSAALTRAYEMGEVQDLSKVMVSQQVSSLGFQMVLNVRNKMLSAYKDIMNMPV
ncbi:MAG: flagellar hook-basal body complex protein FliE [Rhizobiales bacterium TMED83]|jgi:flagellar hook-basal body complex protein FliE|nr:flagellar hook-basal body complex protein FliE [Rhodobiaceae bacterium]RPF94017.1 MAG: flagellar hook-basal body complex protein FliE [Rhizobiales bacterium TMED83]HCD16752.1 flagellar hook-basal body complex protein FliE [Rhodobiaceae bacterium]